MSGCVRVNYRCEDSALAVKLLRTFAIDDAEFSMRLVAKMSPEARALREQIDEVRIRQDYLDLNVDSIFEAIVKRGTKPLPPDSPYDLLPPGVKKFVTDLDRMIELGEAEKVIPLLEVSYSGEYNCPEIDNKHRVSTWPYPYISREKRNEGVFSILCGDLHRIIEEQLYEPRIHRLEGIGLLAAGHRPGIVRFKAMKDQEEIKDAFRALEGVPHNYTIDSFYLGMQPRDHGNTEFYDWKCSAGFGYMDFHKSLQFSFDESMKDASAQVEKFLASQGIKLERME